MMHSTFSLFTHQVMEKVYLEVLDFFKTEILVYFVLVFDLEFLTCNNSCTCTFPKEYLSYLTP